MKKALKYKKLAVLIATIILMNVSLIETFAMSDDANEEIMFGEFLSDLFDENVDYVVYNEFGDGVLI